MTHPRRRSRAALASSTALTLAVLSLAACSGGPEPEPESSDPSAALATPAPEKPTVDTWPLTGRRVGKSGTSSRRHPPLVVKIDNTFSSAPQRGLDEADLVVEELVEGGSTRLAAFFYSRVPELAGPVRSMRASDIGIVSPVGADMVTSGAAQVTIDRIRGAGIDFFAEGDPGFFRDPVRSSPYDLMVDPREVAQEARGGDAERPDDYLSFVPPGETRTGPRGSKAAGLVAAFSGGHSTTWRWADGHWDNTDGYAAEGEKFAADNLLVLRVQVGDAGYLDPAGNTVPETTLVGSGAAMLLHDGRVVRGTWSKKGLKAQLQLKTGAGPIDVPAGRTWIELVPAQGGEVTVNP